MDAEQIIGVRPHGFRDESRFARECLEFLNFVFVGIFGVYRLTFGERELMTTNLHCLIP